MARRARPRLEPEEQRPPGRRATSYDVARLAGVSQSAVSRCFKPGASIAASTRDKVLAAARTLNYQPNAIAQGLITRRSNLVAVLISSLTNLYYPEVLSELTARLSLRGIRVLLFAVRQESEVDEVLDQVWRYRVDGAIAAVRLSDAQLETFARNGVPVVLYNRIGQQTPACSVVCDNAAGERLLVDGLVAAGRRRFGIIAGPGDSYVGEERVREALARLAHHGLEAAVVRGGFDYASGGEGLARLVDQDPGGLDAVICANDLMAIGAIDAARARGLDADALAIVGFDGVGPATWAAYTLTTIAQPVQRMAEAAVSMVIERIDKPDLPPERRLFVGELLTGRSARLVLP
jgi:DNA-binding LacI/PurR family transcriptional regulator